MSCKQEIQALGQVKEREMRDKGEEVGRHQIIKDSEELLEVK